MSRSKYKFRAEGHPYFLTCTIVKWLPVFEDPDVVQIVLDSLKYIQSTKNVHLHAYVIMKDHLHLIASSDNISEEIRLFKSFTARTIIHHLTKNSRTEMLAVLKSNKASHKIESVYQFWQEGSHPEAIVGSAMLEQKIDYVHGNPVRAGFVESADAWPYSSAGVYAGLGGPLEVQLLWS